MAGWYQNHVSRGSAGVRPGWGSCHASRVKFPFMFELQFFLRIYIKNRKSNRFPLLPLYDMTSFWVAISARYMSHWCYFLFWRHAKSIHFPIYSYSAFNKFHLCHTLHCVSCRVVVSKGRFTSNPFVYACCTRAVGDRSRIWFENQ